MPTRPMEAIFMDWSTLIGMGPSARLRHRMAQRHVIAARVPVVVATVAVVGQRVETRSISRQASKW
jgi:hypothetical protein